MLGCVTVDRQDMSSNPINAVSKLDQIRSPHFDGGFRKRYIKPLFLPDIYAGGK